MDLVEHSPPSNRAVSHPAGNNGADWGDISMFVPLQPGELQSNQLRAALTTDTEACRFKVEVRWSLPI